MTEPRIIKWVIAHEPVHLFLRTAHAFASELERATQGRLQIEILTVEDYAQKYNSGMAFENVDSVFEAMSNGDIDISQTSVSHFGRINNNFMALDLPFLFRDHDHATRVFEGHIGKALCESLAHRSGIRGLAFTYSGGWRVIGSNDPITSLQELQGKRVRVSGNPVSYVTMNAIGADPKPHALVGYGYDKIESGDLDATESTYLRFKGKHILKTGHSLFLTTIAVSKKFWDSLDAETQEFMKQAATQAAKIERQWSIEDCEKFERECVENGVTIHELTEQEIQELRTLTQSVYDETQDWFHQNLLPQIRSH
jgi:TRAP-type transport system periplasmic protein